MDKALTVLITRLGIQALRAELARLEVPVAEAAVKKAETAEPTPATETAKGSTPKPEKKHKGRERARPTYPPRSVDGCPKRGWRRPKRNGEMLCSDHYSLEQEQATRIAA
jgi:hypothetical protein